MDVHTENATYTLNPELAILINKEIEGDFSQLSASSLIKDVDIIQDLQKFPEESIVKQYLSSVNHICLNLTNECSQRCGYCVYSGNYLDERVHGIQFMDYGIAIQVIRYFFNLILSNDRIAKSNRFTISFYGGEPLVRFELLKKIVEGSELLSEEMSLNRMFQINFRLNTNALLLDEKIASYLVEKNFSIDISLDGPESEHDKLRKTVDGRNTWQTVWTNVSLLHQKFPEYFKRKVFFSCVVHPLHDHSKVEAFFRTHSHMFDSDRLRMGIVNLNGLDSELRQEIISLFRKKKQTEIYGTLFLSTLFKSSIESKIVFQKRDRKKQFTGTCFPGAAKVYIDVDGRFHICEKINNTLSIGDVYTGFDIDKIKYIYLKYNSEVIKRRCWACDVWSLCDVCYANSAQSNEFVFDCREHINFKMWLLEQYLTKKEAECEDENAADLGDTSAAAFLEQLQ